MSNTDVQNTDGREALAEDSDTLTSAAMSHKVAPVVLKGGEALDRKDRVVFVYNPKDGRITGATTIRGARDGAARVAALLVEALDGERPTMFTCGNCAALRPAPRTGAIPKRCKDCYARSESERVRREQKANPGIRRAREKKYRDGNKESRAAREAARRAANPDASREAVKKYRAKKKAERETEKAKSEAKS